MLKLPVKRRTDEGRRGILTMEMLAALAVLALAIMPVLSVQAAFARYGRRIYYDAVVSEMLGDRISILRRGGWREYGPCENREIGFFGEAVGTLPEGRLLLSVRESEIHTRLLEIELTWVQPDRRGERKIKRNTAVFLEQGERTHD